MGVIAETTRKAADAIASRTTLKPVIGIILGTGLGALAKKIQNDCIIPYNEIPGFAESTVATHAGQLIMGTLQSKPVIVMEGRVHCYEGYTPQEVAFPVRLFKTMGAEILIVSNACGGMNPLLKLGDLMLIDDHINLMGVNPLVGPNEDEFGPRFPDMSGPYDRDLISIAEQVALELQLRLQKGVYAAVMGPNLETRAEYRMLRLLGADVVGMSTVPEVLAATHCGMRTLGISVITDMCFPESLKAANIAEIIKIANEAEPKLARLVEEVIARV